MRQPTELPISQSRARDLINQGIELAKSDRHGEAAEVLGEAATLARANGFEDEELQALLSLSFCFACSDKRKVRPTLKRALRLANSLGDLIAQGKCFLNLAAVTEDKIQAIKQFRMALAAFEQSNYALGTAQVLDNLAVCYRAIGSPRLGAVYAWRARVMFHELKDPLAYATCLSLSGDLLTDLVEAGLESKDLYARARADYTEAMRIFRAIGAPVRYAGCQDHLGLLERGEGNPDAAIAHHEQALHVLTWERAPHSHTSALLHLASAYREAGRPKDALRLFLHIIELKSRLGDDAGVLNARNNEAVIRIDMGEYKEARNALVPVIEHRFQQARSIYHPQTSVGLLSEYAAAWSSFILASIRLITPPPNRSEVIDLVVALEQSKFNVMGRGMSVVPDAGIAPGQDGARTLKQELSLRKRYRGLVLLGQRLKAALKKKKITKATYDEKMDRLFGDNYTLINRLHRFYERHPPKSVETDFKSYCRAIERAVNYSVGVSANFTPNSVYLYLFQFAGGNEMLAAAVTKNDGYISTAKMPHEMLQALHENYNHLLASRPGSHWEQSLAALSGRLGDILQRLEVAPLLEDSRSVSLVASSGWQSMPWQIAALGSGYLGTRCALTQSPSSLSD